MSTRVTLFASLSGSFPLTSSDIYNPPPPFSELSINSTQYCHLVLSTGSSGGAPREIGCSDLCLSNTSIASLSLPTCEWW